jgi:hypothetical protein
MACNDMSQLSGSLPSAARSSARDCWPAIRWALTVSLRTEFETRDAQVLRQRGVLEFLVGPGLEGLQPFEGIPELLKTILAVSSVT